MVPQKDESSLAKVLMWGALGCLLLGMMWLWLRPRLYPWVDFAGPCAVLHFSNEHRSPLSVAWHETGYPWSRALRVEPGRTEYFIYPLVQAPSMEARRMALLNVRLTFSDREPEFIQVVLHPGRHAQVLAADGGCIVKYGVASELGYPRFR